MLDIHFFIRRGLGIAAAQIKPAGPMRPAGRTGLVVFALRAGDNDLFMVDPFGVHEHRIGDTHGMHLLAGAP